ncbi:type IV pilus modification protein PilV [Janthinobacterium sp. GW458P]|uniref:type IV pilus modification protein PilV n=1 Tax=Janthinobacterium sp. GW458P TaxID=1981504 RepID=UPI000A326886|nr:type IV pilus modification protein PilV [Janthinobacterium sp. GW458P]MBE3026887.1 type IV pilus modification protein PilV [Janthinobacterium sp. GW458P]PHV16013.1 type IV pilus modification protein PilV [Janthinobacterium sp. BJB303]
MHGVARGSMDGSSLVEVLVALLLLALGLLGASILQLSSLRARHESALLSAGVQLAAGMAERMRANSLLMQGPDAGNPYLNVEYAAADGAGAAGGAPDCYGACGAAELAQFDIAEWKQQLQSALPGARLRICRDLAAWDAAAEGLHWACSGGQGAPVVIKLGWRARLPDGQPAVNGAGESLPRLAFQLGGGGA